MVAGIIWLTHLTFRRRPLPITPGVISPVPELRTRFMLIFGFGFIGTVIRLRKQEEMP